LGNVARQRTTQPLLVGGSSHLPGCSSAAVAIPADLQLERPGLAKTQDGQAQHAVFLLHIHHASHRVAFVRPEVEETFAVFGRNRVAGARQFKAHGAVFDNYGIASLGKILLQGAGETVGVHSSILALRKVRSATQTRRLREKRTKMGL
jgi:hypothetical protein